MFSAFGNIDQGSLYTAARAWIVLVASGAALVAGLLLIYIPLIRHPATLLAAALALLAVGVLYPEPAWLVAQAAGLGLALVLVAALLARGLPRPREGFGHTELGSSVLESVLGATSSLQRPAGRQAPLPPPAHQPPCPPSPPDSSP